MFAHSLRAGGSWTEQVDHTQTHLGHSTTAQAQTCPEQQLAQTLGEEERQCGNAGITHPVAPQGWFPFTLE